MTAKERERRILQLTIDEISQMDNEVNLYKAIGKMYVCRSIHSVMNLICCRFMMVPRPEMEKDLKTQEKELSDDINNLTKKVSPPIPPVNALLDTRTRRSISKSSSTTLRHNYVT